MIAILYLSVVLVGYLLGSIPFGLLIGKAFAGTDIRQVGSGKTGMTNVMRAAGKKAAALSRPRYGQVRFCGIVRPLHLQQSVRQIHRRHRLER